MGASGLGEEGGEDATYQSAPESARAGLAVLPAAAEAKEVGAIVWWCGCGLVNEVVAMEPESVWCRRPKDLVWGLCQASGRGRCSRDDVRFAAALC